MKKNEKKTVISENIDFLNGMVSILNNVEIISKILCLVFIVSAFTTIILGMTNADYAITRNAFVLLVIAIILCAIYYIAKIITPKINQCLDSQKDYFLTLEEPKKK